MSANGFPIFSFPTVQYASTEVFVFTCNSRPNVTHYIHNKIPELMKLVPSKFKIYNFLRIRRKQFKRSERFLLFADALYSALHLQNACQED